MIIDIAVLLAVYLVFFLSLEQAKYKWDLPSEHTRKFAHVIATISVAFLPYIVSFATVVYVALVFTLVMLLSRMTFFFSSIHDVARQSYGELFMPLGIALAAVLVDGNQELFALAMLVLALSDTAAFYVGRLGGAGSIFNGSTKSNEGTMAFLAITYVLVVIAGGDLFADRTLTVAGVVFVATIATAAEAVSTRGLDNITIPLAVILSAQYIWPF